MVKTIKKYLLILLGTISFILGVIGIFLPLIPTTPFLLLTAVCYVRSSKRLCHWLMNHKVFGSYIHNYIENKSIKKSIKVSALLFLWLTLLISMMIVDHNHLKILLATIGMAVSIHLIMLKS
jgi:hypothetical protein